MEAEPGRQSHHQGLQLTFPSPGIPGLDVVRALHQTVISLRSALDSSREELRRLKESVGDFAGESYVDVVERLALENHVLRRKILSKNNELFSDAATSPPPQTTYLYPLEGIIDSSRQKGGIMDPSRSKIITNDPMDACKSRSILQTGNIDTSFNPTQSDVIDTENPGNSGRSVNDCHGASASEDACGINININKKNNKDECDYRNCDHGHDHDNHDNDQDQDSNYGYNNGNDSEDDENNDDNTDENDSDRGEENDGDDDLGEIDDQNEGEDGEHALGNRSVEYKLPKNDSASVASPRTKTSTSASGKKNRFSLKAVGPNSRLRSVTKIRENTLNTELKTASCSGDKTQKEDALKTDRLEILDKVLEDASLKNTSDGENSVLSDNLEQFTVQQHQQRENQLGDASKPNDQSENDSEELDDIELIFTTDETCRDLRLQEDLVSITETEAWHQQSGAPGQPVLLKYAKSGERESLVCNGEKTSSVEEAVSSQSSSIDREESVDRFDESSRTRLNKIWSQWSVLVETDISKCSVLEETDYSTRHGTRSNSLAAPRTAYRPILHRDALASGRRKSAVPLRPVMDRNNATRRESGAQTDISALPAQWRSESYLAHKVAHTFTTLPSKFVLPAGVPRRLRLSDKTKEARREMLSDISFTSMVPELSRSADHLCQDPHVQTCFSSRGCGLRTPDTHRRESLGSSAGLWPRCNTGTGLPSPCDCHLSTDLYSSRYRGSLTSIPSPGLDGVTGPSRRHSWRATAASFDAWRVPVVTPTPRPTWSSMPSSPTHQHPPTVSSKTAKAVPKKTRSKVTFQECPMTRSSLPNLRSDLIGGENSGDSTESLIDEAEDYLRRSIDSMLTMSTVAVNSDYWSKQTTRRRRTRRHSEPDLIREWHPPQDARPYLPKVPRDLKLDHLVKIISPEGRVLQGRVRYVGPVPGREDAHVGVELPRLNGSSDGTYRGKRYFDCEPDHAIFVPFKKVILAWCTT